MANRFYLVTTWVLSWRLHRALIWAQWALGWEGRVAMCSYLVTGEESEAQRN